MDKLEALRIRSSLRRPLLRFMLIRGTILAGIGAGLIVYGGTYIEPELLEQYGLVLFAGAFALITLGMLPYRRLKRLESMPHELLAQEDEHLLFITKGKIRLTIPYGAITELKYIDHGGAYGIGLTLVSSSPEKIVVHDSWQDMDRLSQGYQRRYGCDLFFPYFSRSSYHSLNDWLFGIEEE